MEVSQVLHNEGPDDLKRLSLELAARMIFLAQVVPTLDDARELALQKLADGSAFRKFRDVVAAQGGDPKALDKFELLPNATGMREITSPRAGYVTAINAEDIGAASGMMGAGRDKKEDKIDPAVGMILEAKVGDKVEAGSVLCRLYYTKEEQVDEAADMVEDAFRISSQKPDRARADSRSRRLAALIHGPVHWITGTGRDSGCRLSGVQPAPRDSAADSVVGSGSAVRCSPSWC